MAIGWHFLTSVVLLYFLEFEPLPERKTDWNCISEAFLCGYASSNFVRENASLIYQLQQLARRIRHLASTPRGRKYHASRIRYYANSDSSFHQARLLISGDVQLNPGPTANSSRCSVCTKIIARNHRALSCDQCDLWCHMKCGLVTPSQYKQFQQKDHFNWICPVCVLSVLPFAEVSISTDEDVHEELLDI